MGKIVSLSEIHDLRREMTRNFIPKAYATPRFNAAQKRIKEIRDVLIESGIECHALDLAVSANKNRPDRDKDDLSCPIEFSVA